MRASVLCSHLDVCGWFLHLWARHTCQKGSPQATVMKSSPTTGWFCAAAYNQHSHTPVVSWGNSANIDCHNFQISYYVFPCLLIAPCTYIDNNSMENICVYAGDWFPWTSCVVSFPTGDCCHPASCCHLSKQAARQRPAAGRSSAPSSSW